MTTLIIIIIVYLTSAIASWMWLHLAFSRNGEWHNIEPDIMCICGVICPVVNTLGAIILWTGERNPSKKPQRQKRPRNFKFVNLFFLINKTQ
jgi:hypothetical protein